MQFTMTENLKTEKFRYFVDGVRVSGEEFDRRKSYAAMTSRHGLHSFSMSRTKTLTRHHVSA